MIVSISTILPMTSSATMGFSVAALFFWSILFNAQVVSSTYLTDIPLSCQDGWEKIDFGCYRLFSDLRPWSSARRLCHSYGGHLATTKDFFENEAVGKFITDQGISEFWIGADRLEISPFSDILRYDDGQEVDVGIGKWWANQPDYNKGACVSVKKNDENLHKWKLVSCEQKLASVCERPVCSQNSFHCINGMCISRRGLCDGFDDCGDESDEMNCASSCSIILKQQSGFIRYPPTGSYDNNENCRWLIEVPEIFNVHLRIQDLVLESYFDKLILLQGGLTESDSEEQDRFSGVIASPIDVYSSNNMMIIKFQTDYSIRFAGFNLTFEGVRPGIAAPRDYVQAVNIPRDLFSVKYPFYQLGSQDSTYIITADNGRGPVTLMIIDLDLAEDSQILIRDGRDVDDNLITTLKGTYKGNGYIISSGKYLYITFQTIRGGSNRGFHFRFWQGCHIQIDADSSFIASPGYLVNDYPNNVICHMNVTIPSAQSVTIRSTYARIHVTDSLKIYDDQHTLLQTIVSNTDNIVVIPGGSFAAVFQSSAIANSLGFNLTFSIDCPILDLNSGETLIEEQSGPYLNAFGSTFVVRCMAGAQFTPIEHQGALQVAMECMAYGQWNVRTSPRCDRIFCPSAPGIENGYVALSMGDLSYGGSITYDCYPGFTFIGSPVINCLFDGSWTRSPTCTSSGCGLAPTAAPGGTRTIVSGLDGQYGSIVRYSCNDGYDLLGTPVSYCDANSWQGNIPTCSRLECYMETPQNADLLPDNYVTIGLDFTILCHSGYEIPAGASLTSTCLEDRDVSSVLSCEDKNECTNNPCNQTCVNTPGSYYCTCRNGFTQNGFHGCTNINECVTLSPCDGLCDDNQGSYSCSCDVGFTLFTANGTEGHFLPSTEDGSLPDDTYWIDHSCVPNQCGNPPSYSQADLLVKQDHYVFGDFAFYACKLGYVLENPTARVLSCSSNKQWTGPTINCIRATCTVEQIPQNLLNPGRLSTMDPEINYLDFIIISCERPGWVPESFQRTRTCSLIDGEYKLDGSVEDYNCGLIDCGTPPPQPDSLFTSLGETYFGSTLTYTCKNSTSQVRGGSEIFGNETVQCLANGQWGFGDLSCPGIQCSDPGQPRLGKQVESDYRDNQQVRFGCLYPGYELDSSAQITCNVASNGGTNWIGRVPDCIDTENPSFINCPPNTFTVAAYSSLQNVVPDILVFDNGGIKNLSISPALPTGHIAMTSSEEVKVFIYTASDYAGNTETCAVFVQSTDIFAPRVECPEYLEVTFHDDQAITPLYSETNLLSLVDNIDARSEIDVRFNPPTSTVDPTTMLIFTVPGVRDEIINVDVTDTSGNTASCNFQLHFKPGDCHPASLRTPPNAIKNCVRLNGGYECTISCNEGYRLYDDVTETEAVIRCVTGQSFPDRHIKCALYDLSVDAGVFQQVFNYTYRNPSSQLLNSAACVTQYRSLFQAAVDVINQVDKTRLFALCDVTGTLFIESVTNSDREIEVQYILRYDRHQLNSQLQFCAIVLSIPFQNPAGVIDLDRFSGGACPDIELVSSGIEVFRGYVCLGASQNLQENQEGLGVCFNCPEGTFIQGSSCTLCPRGWFSPTPNAPACTECPVRTSTFSVGATSIAECYDTCSQGKYNALTGMSPCQNCPRNTFWDSPTVCQPCPVNTRTRGNGATSINSCKAECPPGYFNEIDGHGTPNDDCIPCPRHFYNSLSGQLSCTQCDSTEFTFSRGSISISECFRLVDTDVNTCASTCVSGACQIAMDHVLSCVCDEGWSGENCDQPFNPCESRPCHNGGTCFPAGDTFVCQCRNYTSGVNCETITPSCTVDYCRNSGMCENLPDGPICHCLSGFLGNRCDSPEDICANVDCGFGLCRAHGSVRYTCDCIEGYTGVHCENGIDDCDIINPCRNTGQCIDGHRSTSCDCSNVVDYSGSVCDILHNPCLGFNCGSGQECVTDYLTRTRICVCSSGFVNAGGSQENACVRPNFCDPDPCINGGACDPVGETCICNPGFSGSRCQHNVNECTFNPCLNGGQCTDGINNFDCNCAGTGFEGNICQTEINECRSNGCNVTNTRQCFDNINSYTCDCENGFSGQYCEVNINDCASKPCLHLGTCNDLVNDYSCACAPGWTGNNCELEMNNCVQNPCQNGATCFSVADGYFCRCPPNSYGHNCEDRFEICDIADPCVNGVCNVVNGYAMCSCPFGFTGERCQHRIDYCNTEDICYNNGICIPSLDNFDCTCHEGFSGPNCMIEYDKCSGMNCPPNTQQCIDMRERAYCRCDLDWDGPGCDKVWDQDWDYEIHGIDCEAFAHMPYPIRLNSNAFSITLWVQFFQTDGYGTFFTLFSVPFHNSLSGKTQLLRMDKYGVYFNDNGTLVHASYDYDFYDDGQWHYVVVTVDGSTGEISIIVDTVRTDPVAFTPVDFDLYIWPLLGCKYDTEEDECYEYDGFSGKLSRVTIYSRVLIHRDEVTLIGNENVNVVFPDSLLRWKEYDYFGCVTRRAPSVADASCPFGYINFPACDILLPGKNLVTLAAGQTCPSDITIYSTERLTSVTWTVPNFNGQATIRSTSEPDTVFIWGKYPVIIEASNDDDSTALCLFDIYIRNDQCTNIPVPSNAASNVCFNQHFGPGRVCEPQCRTGYADSIPSPIIDTCGMTGNWNPLEPFMPYRISPCGLTSEPEENMHIDVFYSIPSTECLPVAREIRDELLKTQILINQEWFQVCQLSDCSNITFIVNCSRGATTELQASILMNNIVSRAFLRSDLSVFLSVPDLYQSLILARDNNLFDYQNSVSDAFPVHYTITTDLDCDAPKVLLGEQCVECGPGTFYNKATRRCHFCPRDQFQQSSGQYGCENCGEDMATAQVGSTNRLECHASCRPGMYFDINEDKCKNCSYGFYQPRSGQFYCEPCSAQQTTRANGTILGSFCANDCPAGQQIGVNNNCVDCPIGYFRTTQPTCEACPSHLVTSTTGSLTAASCDVANNPAGTRRLANNLASFEPCPIGTYQPMSWQSVCLPCGLGYRTDSIGSISQNDCKFFCPAGQQKRAADDSCEDCPVGYYRDGLNFYDPCDLCPSNYTTVITGALSSSACTLFRCAQGQKPNANGDGCELCPRGTFQSQADQDSCETCPFGQSTRNPGASSAALCLTYCSSGSQLTDSGACDECSIGEFKDNSIDVFSNCTPCSDGRYTTSGSGSTSETECTILNCGIGTFINASSEECILCPLGTYQDEAFQPSCKDCIGQTSTIEEGSTESSACQKYCDSGYEVFGSICRVCQRGYYKDNSINLFMECTACSSDFITPLGPPAISVNNCTEPNCSHGSYTVNNGCQPCALGYYQDQRWQHTCNECPQDKTTTTVGADSLDLCLLSCERGFESPQGTETCVSCQEGFYKDVVGVQNCTACTDDLSANNIYISAGPGATSRSECNTLACGPGFYPAGVACDVCNYGFYQPNIMWRSACLPCGSDRTTYVRGASNFDQCWLECVAGEEYLPSTGACSKCAIGFYRNNLDPVVYSCSQCHSGFITADVGAVSSQECVIVDCSELGTYRDPDLNICKDCPIGTYQDTPRQTSCKPCMDNYITVSTRTGQESHCIYDCPVGTELDETIIGIPCRDCPAGTYRSSSVMTCQQCPNDLTTSTPRADDIADCNTPTCSPGYAFRDSSCQQCAKDTYQNQPGQNWPCKFCPDEKVTSGLGSDSVNDCNSPCDASDCSVTAEVCVNNRSIAGGYLCECAQYFNRNPTTGDCIHQCDENYCGQYAICRRNPLECQCTEGYFGDQCENPPAASALSDEETRDILIISVTTIAFILLLILLVVFIFVKFCRKKNTKKNEYDDRASIATPSDMPVFSMNPAYSSKAPSLVFGGSQAGLRGTSTKVYDNPTIGTEDQAVYTA